MSVATLDAQDLGFAHPGAAPLFSGRDIQALQA